MASVLPPAPIEHHNYHHHPHHHLTDSEWKSRWRRAATRTAKLTMSVIMLKSNKPKGSNPIRTVLLPSNTISWIINNTTFQQVFFFFSCTGLISGQDLGNMSCVNHSAGRRNWIRENRPVGRLVDQLYRLSRLLFNRHYIPMITLSLSLLEMMI